MRFPLMVAEALRAIWPVEKPLFYRASSLDNVPGGLLIEDTVALAKGLKARGVDLMDCSSGGMSGPATLSSAKIKPGYQVPYAAAIRRSAGVPTMTVGAIIEPRQAETILAAGDADLIALGRQLMAEPHWLYRAALELGEEHPSTVLDKHYSFYLERRAAVLER
jgi:2,4-dienoyl-CoA reductase-like NADH-dependent reductase (Old Yellow Enzyme family)